MAESARPHINNDMIFITGASRSGTTLMSFVLRNHSQVYGLRELQYFGESWDPNERGRPLGTRALAAAAARIYARQDNGVLSLAPPNDAHRARALSLLASLPPSRRDPAEVFAAAVHDICTQGGKKIPCEQTPRNIFYAEALLETYPNARFVHMMRDPRAVMASQKKRWRRRDLSFDRTTYPLYHTLRDWVNYHPYTTMKLWATAARKAQDLSGHPRFSIVRFEDLIDTPEAVVRDLCSSLGLEYEPRMLDVQQINSSHQSAAGGARRGIHRDARDTWRRTLTPIEVAIAERLCHDLMDSQGYSPSMPERAQKHAREIRYMLSYLPHLAGVVAVNPRRAWIQAKAALRPTRRRTAPDVR